jgi:hypothetical protein
MKARQFANQLKDAGVTLRLVSAIEPDVVVRHGLFSEEIEVRAVKVRHEFKQGRSFVILEVREPYPTEDAYLAVCRALHWRDAQIRAMGGEPVKIPMDGPHYPPEGFDWKEHMK